MNAVRSSPSCFCFIFMFYLLFTFSCIYFALCNLRIYIMSGNNKYRHSANPAIESGYYHGLQKDVWMATGISQPTIHAAIRTGKASSEKRMQAIETALKLIAERNQRLSKAAGV